jgi:hypothetical protein
LLNFEHQSYTSYALHQDYPLVLALISISFIGCNSSPRNQRSFNFTKVYVESPQSFDSTNVNQLNSTVIETAEENFEATVTLLLIQDPDAQAVLRSTWHLSSPNNNIRKEDVSVALSMSIFTNEGKKVFSADSGSAVPVSFWSVAKTAVAVDDILSQMPVAERASK